MKHVIYSLILLTLVACQATNQATQAKDAATTWLVIAPVQCLGNPWETDWLANHDNDYNGYPIGDPLVIEKAEATIIRQYFTAQGYTILKITSKPFGNDILVCDACHCPQGYYLYLQAATTDVAALVEQYGFTISTTAP